VPEIHHCSEIPRFKGNATTGITLSVTGGSDTSLSLNYSVATSAATGVQYLLINNALGHNEPLKLTVALPQPTITSVTPSQWNAGTTVSFTIAGNNFGTVPTVGLTLPCAAVTSATVSAASNTSINASVAIPANCPGGNGAVSVTNHGYGSPLNNVPPTTSAGGGNTVTIIPYKLQAATITWNSSTISGTTNQKAVVGQPMALKTNPNLPAGLAVSSSTWTVGGTNIGGYTPTTTSFATASVTPTTLTATTINFYWVYPASSVPVTYQYCVDLSNGSRTCSPTATATFSKISGPTATGTSTTSAWTITPTIATCAVPPVNVKELAFGTYSGGTTCKPTITTAGIAFVASPGSSPSGKVEYVQLLVTNNITFTSADGPTVQNAGTGLDNTFPYPSIPTDVNQTNDSPSNSLPPNTAGGTIYTKAERNFTAKMYLLWTSSIAGSVPVPLGYTQWIIDGIATYNMGNGKWTASHGAGQGVNPSLTALTKDDGTVSHGYPVWTTVAKNK